MVTARRAAALALLLLAACSGPAGDDAGPPDAGPTDAGVDAGPPPAPRADYYAQGPYPVGNARVTVIDDARARTFAVELWYPAAEAARAQSEAGQPLAAFEREPPRSDTLAGLLADAPSCVRAQTRSSDAPAPATGGPWPLVVSSHCHACTRFDLAAVSERLASHGIVVAAPDHEGNTLWDALAGDPGAIDEATLELRVADLRHVLDTALGDDPAVPDGLRGNLDAARVAVMGHSFGAATAGITAARDDRVRAGVALAAPITALGGGARITTIQTPFLFVLATEDNSIGEAGNLLIENEHRRIDAPAVLAEIIDAGHWSVSDYPGLVDLFAAGCGDGVRQTDGAAFTYLDPARGREVTAGLVTAYLASALLDDPGGVGAAVAGPPGGGVTVSLNGR